MSSFPLIKKIILALMAVEFLIGSEANVAMANDEQELIALYHQMWRWLIDKNVEKLDEMHSADFVLVHMTGMNQPKAEYLRSIRDGVLNYFSEDTDNVYIKIDGDKAKLTGQSRVNAAVFGGGRHTWRLQLAFDVEKISGKWILKHARASTY